MLYKIVENNILVILNSIVIVIPISIICVYSFSLSQRLIMLDIIST